MRKVLGGRLIPVLILVTVIGILTIPFAAFEIRAIQHRDHRINDLLPQVHTQQDLWGSRDVAHYQLHVVYTRLMGFNYRCDVVLEVQDGGIVESTILDFGGGTIPGSAEQYCDVEDLSVERQFDLAESYLGDDAFLTDLDVEAQFDKNYGMIVRMSVIGRRFGEGVFVSNTYEVIDLQVLDQQPSQ